MNLGICIHYQTSDYDLGAATASSPCVFVSLFVFALLLLPDFLHCSLELEFVINEMLVSLSVEEMRQQPPRVL